MTDRPLPSLTGRSSLSRDVHLSLAVADQSFATYNMRCLLHTAGALEMEERGSPALQRC